MACPLRVAFFNDRRIVIYRSFAIIKEEREGNTMKQLSIYITIFLSIVLSINTASAEETLPQWRAGEVVALPSSTVVADLSKSYTLTLQQDQLVTFTVHHRNIGERISLQHSDGTNTLVLASMAESENEAETVVQLQLRKGTYTAHMNRAYNEPLHVSYTTLPLTNTYDIEPNNTPEQASEVPINTIIPLSQTVNGLYEDDYFQFTLHETSEVVLYSSFERKDPQHYSHTIQLVGSPRLAMSETKWRQEDWPNLSAAALHELTAPGKPLPSRAGIHVLPAGTYYVHLQFGQEVYNPNIVFQIAAKPLAHGDTYKITSEGSPIHFNQVYRGIFGSISSYDEYVFTTAQQKEVAIVTEAFPLTKRPVQAGLFSWTYLEPSIIEGYLRAYDTHQTAGRYAAAYHVPAGAYSVYLFSHEEAVGMKMSYELAVYELVFSDVRVRHRYLSEIMQLHQLGIIKGYTDGSFKPADTITRKQVLTMLGRDEYLNLQKIRDMVPFSDLPASGELVQLVQPFYEAGIMDGSDGTIRLNDTLTRAQLAKILVKTYGLTMQGEAIPFSDVSTQHGSYHDIQILASNGITTGDNGKFMPNAPVSRQHFSVFLSRIVNK